jgi:hypothetical protein
MSMRIVIVAVMLALVGENAFSQQLLRSYELAAHCKTVDALCKAYLGGYIDAAQLYQLWITTQRTPLPTSSIGVPFFVARVSPRCSTCQDFLAQMNLVPKHAFACYVTYV